MKLGEKFMWHAVLLFFVLFLSACGAKTEENSSQPEWNEGYGIGEGAAATAPVPTEEAQKPSPTSKLPIKSNLPTPIPPRAFTPGENQTELILWLQWDESDRLDDHIFAELNHILQERQCSFYLTKKVGQRAPINEASPWQDFFDAGETVDLICLGNGDRAESYLQYGKTSIERVIEGGYLLPFSEYPDTEAKKRLWEAYPENYWRLCSFLGENYGTSYSSRFIEGGRYLLLNLDAAEQAGIGDLEQPDLLQLDEVLQKAKNARVPGIRMDAVLGYCGIKKLTNCLFVKQKQDGGYVFVNPFLDEEVLGLWDAMHRYKENGWYEEDWGKLPLVLATASSGDMCYLQDGRFFLCMPEEEVVSARVRVCREEKGSFLEGNLLDIFGIAAASQHKEEALELFCLMQTDEEIVQLLRYGVENVHYRRGENGLEKIKTFEAKSHDGGTTFEEKTWKYPGYRMLGNNLMEVGLDEAAGRNYGEAEYYGEISETGLISYLGDLLADRKEEMEQIGNIFYLKIGGCINSYPMEDFWKEENYKEEIDRMREALDEAGYNEIIKEVNKRVWGDKKGR